MVGLGYLECHTPNELSFAGLYFLPVALAAWAGGLGWGLAASLGIAVDWVVADLAMARAAVPSGLRLWTGFNHFAAYAFLAWMVDRLHRSYSTERLAREEMERALEAVKTLEGLFPICAWCRRIRDDQGYWNQIEEYLAKQKGARVSHGICPECMEKARAEVEDFRLPGSDAASGPR